MRNSKKKIVCLYAMGVMFILTPILFDEEMPTGIDSVSARVISILLFVIAFLAFLGFIHFGTKEGEEDEEIIKEAKRLREQDKELLDLLELNEEEKFRKIAKQIAERYNKYGVTLTDPRTGRDLLAGMTDEQREKYRQFLESTHRTRQQKKGKNKE